MQAAAKTYPVIGPFQTHGTLGLFFAAGLTLSITAVVVSLGVMTYSAAHALNCHSERGTALMVGTISAAAAGCLTATAFRTLISSAIAAVVVLAVVFTAGQLVTHAAFLNDCSPHRHWFQ
jgi:hypothetical protein